MKKAFALIVIVFLTLALFVGCGNDSGTPDSGTTGGGTTEGGTTGGGTTEGGTEENPQTYTVTWMDENGKEIGKDTLSSGAIPSKSYVPTDNDEWDRTFVGWSLSPDGNVIAELPALTGNVTYYAKVISEKKTYTVTFVTGDGSKVPTQTVEYGAKAEMPESPELSGYRFVGWSTDPTNISEVDFDKPIYSNTVYYAIWNEKVEVADVKGFLLTLLKGYKFDPYSYIPESMRHDYAQNLVDENDVITDYSNFVNVSDITYGHGEQWHMVLDNLNQTKTFYNVLSVVDSLSTISIATFNDYFDKNPDNTAHCEFDESIYSVTIDFDGKIISYVLDYTADVPVFGTQTIQIAIAMNVLSGERIVRIQIGDANSLKYTVLEDSYEFAIRYLGVRDAMFSIRDLGNGVVAGNIYEYITVSSVKIESTADFYITDDYVSVVGNKADGMLGFDSYISELYDADNGALIGYEVAEKLSLLEFDTIWFNLNDISGIHSIKYVSPTENTEGAIYVNGLSSEWQTKPVGTINRSRRFDIEFRTQYVYSFDEETGEYIEHKIQVPMFFVQEDYYDNLDKDVKAVNNITIGVEVNGAEFDKLLYDYDTLVPVFIENKENMNPEIIDKYIGDKYVFID